MLTKRSWLTFAVALLALLSAESRSLGTEGPKTVVVFYSEERANPAMVTMDQALRSTFRRAPGRIQIFNEYLDQERIFTESYERGLIAYLREKYQDKKFDLIVAVGAPALRMLNKNGETLYPGVPVVFGILTRRNAEGLNLGSNGTGVTARIDWEPTLDLALNLHPDTRRVIVVAGDSSVDRLYVADARQEFSEEKRVEFTYLIGLQIEELQRQLAHVSDQTIIIYVSFSKSPDGNYFTPAEGLSLIAPHSVAPIYGCWEPVLGQGIVGGQLISMEAIAAHTSEIGLRVLAGEPPSSIPIETLAGEPMFDWRELRRWGIDEKNLPAGSIVQFRVPSIWDGYKWRIISVMSLVIVQSVLIVGLVLNRVRRKRAEESLQRSQSELAHVGRVMITGELAATIAHEVNQPLTAMVANANATRRILGNENANLDEAREAIDDIVKDAHRASEVVARIRSLLRKDPRSTEPLAINEVIEDVVAIARNDLVGKRVSLKMELGEGLPKVEADRVEIQQVMLNLMMNAVDAMRNVEDGGRKLVIRTAKDESGGALIEVQDSGIGIASENLERVFDAFYTTRKEGMGMGLSICRTIVEAHGGKLWAQANNDKGATFRFTLRTAQKSEVSW